MTLRSPLQSYVLCRLKFAMPLQRPKCRNFDSSGRAIHETEINRATVPVHAKSSHIIIPGHGIDLVPITPGGGQPAIQLTSDIVWVSPVPRAISEHRHQGWRKNSGGFRPLPRRLSTPSASK